MLEVKSLTKLYGKTVGAENISFEIAKGETVGFIGPNGAGKSTTMNMITGCLSPSNGEIKVDDINSADDPVNVKRLIGYLPEQPPLYNEFTVSEYLKLVLKMKKSTLEPKGHIDVIVEKFGLKQVENRLIGNLSKGYRQRVGLAQAFTANPPYVILDEPTVGLDPKQKKQTLSLIKNMSSACGILLSSHILSEISFVCDRIIIIDQGKIVKQIHNTPSEKNTYMYQITGSKQAVLDVLVSAEGVISAAEKNGTYIVEADDQALQKVFYALAEHNMPITGLKLYSVDIEKEFLRATQQDGR